MKKIRVLVLIHEHLVPPESVDKLSDKQVHEMQMELDVLEALEQLGHEVIQVPVTEDLKPIRRAIEEHRPHVACNLLVSFQDIGMYDAHVMSYLELLRTPYTGCNPRGIMLASNKPLSKKVLSYHRIPVPGFKEYQLRCRSVTKPKRLQFPLIVKSSVEHSSVGIAQASIVHDDKSLEERVDFVHRHIGTSAIAEEYIEGREFTVSLIGNERLEAFPVWELRFTNLPEGSENIATSKVKWDIAYQEKVGVETGPATDLPSETAARIAKLSKRIYRALSLSGYARVDLRMNAEGEVFVLEANPNPDLCNHEDLAASAAASGLEYPKLIQKILTLGQSYRPAWKDR